MRNPIHYRSRAWLFLLFLIKRFHGHREVKGSGLNEPIKDLKDYQPVSGAFYYRLLVLSLAIISFMASRLIGVTEHVHGCITLHKRLVLPLVPIPKRLQSAFSMFTLSLRPYRSSFAVQKACADIETVIVAYPTEDQHIITRQLSYAARRIISHNDWTRKIIEGPSVDLTSTANSD